LGGGGLQILDYPGNNAGISVDGLGKFCQGVFLGILSLSSTAVVLLIERNETATPHGQVMLGILVVQDLALGLMLAVLPALNQPTELISIAVLTALLRLGLFTAGAVAAFGLSHLFCGFWLEQRAGSCFY